MSTTTTSTRQNVAAENEHTHTHVLVVGNDDYDGHEHHFRQVIEAVLDDFGIEKANFLLPENGGVTNAIIQYVFVDGDNPHTANRTCAPPQPEFALPLAEYAFIFEARAAPQRGIRKYQDWLDAAKRHLGDDCADAWVAKP